MNKKLLIGIGITVVIVAILVGTFIIHVYKPTPTREQLIQEALEKAKIPLTTPERSYVKAINGTPKLFVGEKEVEITGFYTTTRPIAGSEESIDNVMSYIDKAAENNFSFVIVGINWILMDKTSLELAPPNSRQLYKEGKYEEIIEKTKTTDPPENAAELIDWELLDEIFDYAASKGIYLVPSFEHHRPPLWWIKSYKTHLQTNNTGEIVFMPGFNSPYYEKYADQVITAMVNRYRDHPALLGWDLSFGYTEENNYPGGPAKHYSSLGWYDYSEFAKQRFRGWLREEYDSNVSALRKAWINDSITFENAQMPKPLPDISNPDEIVNWLNGPGDTRRQWYDWQLFRLEEKKLSRDHFAKLYKSLDTNHVLFATPSVPLSTNRVESAYRMDGDYYDFVSPYIDIVFVNPGIDMWESPIIKAAFNNFVKYFEAREKAVFIKWEARLKVSNSEKILKECTAFARRTGSGIVLWEGKIPMPDGNEMQPEFTDAQIELVANIFHTTPEGRLEKSDFAIIENPMLGFFDYRQVSGELKETMQGKGKEMLYVGASLSSAGLDCDVITTKEIVKNPEILNDYKAAALITLARMNESVLNAILDFRDSGGGVFIVGRTGLFDEYGKKNTSYLKKLLNVTSIDEYKETCYPWRFAKGDALLKEIENREISGENKYLLYLPTFDYEKEGYKVLAHLDNYPEVATVGYKGKTVFWFPIIDLKDSQRFLWNLYDFYDIDTEK